jgi:hypothetical protein
MRRTNLRTVPTVEDPSTLREKYSGRRLSNIFVVDAGVNRSHTLRDIPLQMSVVDFVRYVAHQIGYSATEVRLMYGSKTLTQGKHCSRQIQRLSILNGLTRHQCCAFNCRLRSTGGEFTVPSCFE